MGMTTFLPIAFVLCKSSFPAVTAARETGALLTVALAAGLPVLVALECTVPAATETTKIFRLKYEYNF